MEIDFGTDGLKRGRVKVLKELGGVKGEAGGVLYESDMHGANIKHLIQNLAGSEALEALSSRPEG